ncbi:shikimate kinase [Oxobacter pfennigii]|uniref:Shikimate kinase n=1 Tax=Oxobacter pfennigii TaxID=36849 RepID=A0A0P9AL87_9CLOT|nr:AAA family ATPase [Oxobacter pfennigii]KPU46131.1 shikimate kinase [Oxobacter pfennigii]
MKIQVIGASGTGKSTLGKYISKKTGVYWIDTDKYLWKDPSFTENYPVEERFEMYNNDIANHQYYIVSGSVHSWNPQGFNDREMLVLLIIDEEIRMKRIYDREFSRFGERMLPDGDHYQLTCEFIDWCKTYLTADENAVNSLANHKLRLKDASCKTLILDGNQPVDILCTHVLNAYWADPSG